MIKIEVVYAPLKRAIVSKPLQLQQTATVADALEMSGIYISHPETLGFSVGIFSKQVTLEHGLKEGDRVEIYRPLIVDPKENRRKKASAQK